MTPGLLRLAAHLLDMAGGKFSRHGCSDFDLPEFVTDEDRAALLAAAKEAHANDGDEDVEGLLSYDWIVMFSLATLLEERAAEMGDVPAC